GWRRSQWFDETGLPWTPPSPNMPDLESATHYPGTCLFEGTNLSVGRGTDAAFQQIGAPWLDHETLARRLDEYGFPGVRFEAVTFTPENPGDGRYGGEPVKGVRFVTTDRAVYDPTVAAVAALVEIRRLHPDRLEWVRSPFDRLAGTPRLREQIMAGAGVEEITAPWAGPLAEFRQLRERYLLYRDASGTASPAVSVVPRAGARARRPAAGAPAAVPAAAARAAPRFPAPPPRRRGERTREADGPTARAAPVLDGALRVLVRVRRAAAVAAVALPEVVDAHPLLALHPLEIVPEELPLVTGRPAPRPTRHSAPPPVRPRSRFGGARSMRRLASALPQGP